MRFSFLDIYKEQWGFGFAFLSFDFGREDEMCFGLLSFQWDREEKLIGIDIFWKYFEFKF